MARKLEKIEKEMGYCEVKLEKERRARKQIDYVQDTLRRLSGLAKVLRPHDALFFDPGGPELSERPDREAFLAAGLLDLVEEKRDVLERERDELLGKLHHYNGFEGKKKALETEKAHVLLALGARSERVRRINDEFTKIEKVWNELTEDLINLDEGLFFVDRNLDYLRSARNFLIAAKGNYDVENWRREGYIADLFRHSSLGRAREMADGADRNLQSAEKELACVAALSRNMRGGSLTLGGCTFARVLIPFIEALYEDLFINSQIKLTIQVVEGAIANNLKLQSELHSKKESLSAKVEETEKMRAQLFQRMGTGRRRELTT